MASFFLACVLVFGVFALPASVHAAQTGDMFDDKSYTLQSRPWVPSDQYEGYRSQSDIFGTPPSYMRTDKDMFDSVQAPPNPGIEEIFSAHPHTPVPDEPLFHNPNIPGQ